ncbi:MAG: hypothetical protein HOH04_13970, partial [Rhodospirillaceae bacterium]|nr:hypothetical protein [Rhodospirillaceae bacterium]
MNTVAKIAIAAGATLVVGTGIAAMVLPDDLLHSVGGPVGDKVVHMKHAVHDGVADTIDGTIYGVKSLWWDVAGGKAFDSSPRVVVELPKKLREQFGK